MENQEVENQEINQEAMGDAGDSHESAHDDGGEGQESNGFQKRLKRQEKKHQREVRDLKSQLDSLQSKFQSQQPEVSSGNFGGMDEEVQKAISHALQQREQKAHGEHVQRQYHELGRHLDDVSDKYDDFDDVVRHEGANFTPHMRDAALLLPKKGAGSAGEVFYKLGKNSDELERISRLHPVDQAREMVQLSHALHRGDDIKNSSSDVRQLGQVKHNPSVNSGKGINDKTPISEIRNRMKNNTWK